MSKRPVQRHLSHVLTLSLAVILLGGGIAFLIQWHDGSQTSYASGDSVVGRPSLPAATVDSIFRQMGSPMVGTGKAIESASRAQNIDDAFALAVFWTETNDGAAGVGLADRNPGSVRGSVGYPSAYDGYTIYPSYSAAVTYWFSMLKQVYINRGLTTVSAIAHPYVGTSTSNLWAGKVIALMQHYRAIAPPPTPTPTRTIPADLKRQAKQLTQEQQQTQGKSTYYPPVVPVSQSKPKTSTATASGLNGTGRTMLVIFDLLLALGLALWARSLNKRSAVRPQVAPALSSTSNPWEQLRANQQSAAFFNSFSGPLRNTEELTPDLAGSEIWTIATSTLPAYSSSEALLSLGALMAGQAQFQSTQTPPPVPVPVEQVSFFDVPQHDFAQATPVPGFGLPGLFRQTNSLTPDPLPHSPLFSPFNIGEEDAGPQLQPVGVGAGGGRSNGLLSRYREMQARSEQEP